MGNNCNTCVFSDVLERDRPHIIVDPGHVANEMDEDCLGSLEEAMAGDEIKIEDTGLIINTHCHPDHCEANDLVIEKSGARVTMSKEEDEFRTTIGKVMFSMFGMKPPGFTPAYFLKEGIFSPGNNAFKLEIMLTPGHSPGSVCLYVPDKKVLITGDVIFFMSVGRTDFPGGDIQLLRNSIQRLSRLDTEYLVPGHNTEPNGVIRGRDQIKRNFQAIEMYF